MIQMPQNRARFLVRYAHAIGTFLLVTCVLQAMAAAQSGGNMLRLINVSDQTVSGDWRLKDGELQVGSDASSRLVIADSTPRSYSLTIEFTRVAGDNSIAVILPVGSSQCAFIMSAFNGQAHGIGVIDGQLARSNSTTITPGTLKNDHRYRLQIEVSAEQDSASISSTLDGRPFLKWSGDPASLSMLDFWRLPKQSALGFCTYTDAKFHSVILTKLDPTMRMTDTSSPGDSQKPTLRNNIRFEDMLWIAPRADSVSVEEFASRQALHITGGEENFVWLPDVAFSDGTIEVDIASDTFSGIGFRADKDGTVAEKVYLRPFNSGTNKHENTVQYSMLGKAEYSWRALRESFPGKYESGANIRANEWFHLRVEINDSQLKAYIDEDTTPVLVVDKLLGDREAGRIGVWGWDSYFANFRFESAK